MHRDPMDMVEEMDELFARLFSRIDREFMNDTEGYEYRIAVRDDGDDSGNREMADEATQFSRVTGRPVAEVHRIGDEVKVITSLPGITEESLRLDVKRGMLIIDAGDADHAYLTSAELPPVDLSSMRKTLKNGVLEVTFASLPGQPGKA